MIKHLRAVSLCTLSTLFSIAAYGGETDELLDRDKWSVEQKASFQQLDEPEQKLVLQMLKQDWPELSPTDEDELFLWEDSIKVDQIVSDNAFIGKMNGDSVWIQGVDTTSFADDEVLSCSNIAFLNAGNERYQTVIGGTKTVRKYQVYSSADPIKLVQSVLNDRGLRMFRMPRAPSSPWVIAEVQTVTKTSATIRPIEAKRSMRFDGSSFSKIDQEWLSDKENYTKLKANRKQFEASQK